MFSSSSFSKLPTQDYIIGFATALLMSLLDGNTFEPCQGKKGCLGVRRQLGLRGEVTDLILLEILCSLSPLPHVGLVFPLAPYGKVCAQPAHFSYVLLNYWAQRKISKTECFISALYQVKHIFFLFLSFH